MVELTTQSFHTKVWVNPRHIVMIHETHEGSALEIQDVEDWLRVTESPVMIVAQILAWERRK